MMVNPTQNSLYLRAQGVSRVRIEVYPKRRRHLDVPFGISEPVRHHHAPTAGPDAYEPTYADFLAPAAAQVA